MASNTFYFDGKCKWAKVYKVDDKYEPQWNIQVYLEDWDMFKKSGCSLKKKEDEDGEYVRFSRKVAGPSWNPVLEPPKITNSKGEVITDLIGNDSHVTVKVEVFDTPRTGGKGHRLEAVRVNKLVKYERPSEKEETETETQVKEDAPKKLAPKGVPF